MVSGGDALVELVAPFGIKRALQVGASVRIDADVDGVPVSAGDLRGATRRSLVRTRQRLKVGKNVLTARFPGKTMKLTLTNHPIGGPVFSGGSQLSPWICARKEITPVNVSAADDPSLVGVVNTRASGLSSDPVDSQCNTSTDYLYYYQPQSKWAPAARWGLPAPIHASCPTTPRVDPLTRTSPTSPTIAAT
jgi:hypothetical protein